MIHLEEKVMTKADKQFCIWPRQESDSLRSSRSRSCLLCLILFIGQRVPGASGVGLPQEAPPLNQTLISGTLGFLCKWLWPNFQSLGESVVSVFSPKDRKGTPGGYTLASVVTEGHCLWRLWLEFYTPPVCSLGRKFGKKPRIGRKKAKNHRPGAMGHLSLPCHVLRLWEFQIQTWPFRVFLKFCLSQKKSRTYSI